MFNGFSHSVMGASHEKTNLVCQDSSAFKIGDHYALAVVADGHGSKKHFRSHLGSKFAVEATIEAIDRFYEEREALEASLPVNHKLIIRNIEKQIISNWNVKVDKHLSENPVTDKEKENFTEEEFEAILPESYYGTTLVAAVSGDNYTFGLQIGDGSLVALFEDAKAVMPMEYNESAPANVTASMCNSNAASLFSSFYAPNKKLIALYGSTDGLYTSFGSEYDFLDYHTIITSQLVNIESFKTVIKNNLEKRSHFGTEDDISLACIYNEKLLTDRMDLIRKRVDENKKAAAERREAALSKQV
ncbi:MAG: protein phosphatase 2C domain-containing protein [Ruminococcus sp.]|nr:protein phosphatase 2C domain-containing protein [Ruminococcus sp.]